MPDDPNRLSRFWLKEKMVTPISWRIATYVNILVILGILLFNIISHKDLSQNLVLHGKCMWFE